MQLNVLIQNVQTTIALVICLWLCLGFLRKLCDPNTFYIHCKKTTAITDRVCHNLKAFGRWYVETMTQLTMRRKMPQLTSWLVLFNRITAPEGLFLGTTSSVITFVKEFNKFFNCPSKNGQCKGKASCNDKYDFTMFLVLLKSTSDKQTNVTIRQFDKHKF